MWPWVTKSDVISGNLIRVEIAVLLSTLVTHDWLGSLGACAQVGVLSQVSSLDPPLLAPSIGSHPLLLTGELFRRVRRLPFPVRGRD